MRHSHSIPYNVVVWLKLFCQVLQPERITFFWAMSSLPYNVWPKRRPQPRQHLCMSVATPEPDTEPQPDTRARSSSSRYGFAVYAFSPRDGGWVRWGTERPWPTKKECWDFVFLFRPLWEGADDYWGFKVVRTTSRRMTLRRR